MTAFAQVTDTQMSCKPHFFGSPTYATLLCMFHDSQMKDAIRSGNLMDFEEASKTRQLMRWKDLIEGRNSGRCR